MKLVFLVHRIPPFLFFYFSQQIWPPTPVNSHPTSDRCCAQCAFEVDYQKKHRCQDKKFFNNSISELTQQTTFLQKNVEIWKEKWHMTDIELSNEITKKNQLLQQIEELNIQLRKILDKFS